MHDNHLWDFFIYLFIGEEPGSCLHANGSAANTFHRVVVHSTVIRFPTLNRGLLSSQLVKWLDIAVQVKQAKVLPAYNV